MHGTLCPPIEVTRHPPSLHPDLLVVEGPPSGCATCAGLNAPPRIPFHLLFQYYFFYLSLPDREILLFSSLP